MIIPDPDARTVRLIVEFVDGRWILLDGGELPGIKNGTVADLVFAAHAILDDVDRTRWTRHSTTLLLNEGTTLGVRVYGPRVPKELANWCHKANARPGPTEYVVEVILLEDLYLVVRPGKLGLLRDCRCRVPALNVEAASVNEAYTRVSEKFEPWRRSHTGNVFEKVFVESGDYLRPLKYWRSAAEAVDCRIPDEARAKSERMDGHNGETGAESA